MKFTTPRPSVKSHIAIIYHSTRGHTKLQAEAVFRGAQRVQHGMIFVGLEVVPSSNRPENMNQITGPGTDAHNRVGSFMGSMDSSFGV